MEKTPGRIWAARVIALTADAVQLGFFPLFVGGAPEGFDAVLDIAVGAAMVALCGWHWAFLPAFAAELLPGIDLAPTWTIAVLIATRQKPRVEEPVKAERIDPPALPPAK